MTTELTVEEVLGRVAVLDRKVDEITASMRQDTQEAYRQLQTLQGGSGLLEPLSNISGWKLNDGFSDPNLANAVTYIGAAQQLLAGSHIKFSRPANTPFLRVDLTGAPCYDYTVCAEGCGTHTTLAGPSGALQAAIAAGGKSVILQCSDETISLEALGTVASTVDITIVCRPLNRKKLTIGPTAMFTFHKDTDLALHFVDVNFAAGAGSRHIFSEVAGGVGTPGISATFDRVNFDTAPVAVSYIVNSGIIGSGWSATGVALYRCTGQIDGLFQSTAVNGNAGPFRLWYCDTLTISKAPIDVGANGSNVWGSLSFEIEGGVYAVTVDADWCTLGSGWGINIENCRITWSGTSLSTRHLFHVPAATNCNKTTIFKNIVYITTRANKFFGMAANFLSALANPIIFENIDGRDDGAGAAIYMIDVSTTNAPPIVAGTLSATPLASWSGAYQGPLPATGSVPFHNILSASHADSLAGTVVTGDTIVGNATPAWARLARGAAGSVLFGDGAVTTWTINPTIAGYMRVGNAAAPVNVTAGDLTVARFNLGNVAFNVGNVFQITGQSEVLGQLTVTNASLLLNNTVTGVVGEWNTSGHMGLGTNASASTGLLISFDYTDPPSVRKGISATSTLTYTAPNAAVFTQNESFITWAGAFAVTGGQRGFRSAATNSGASVSNFYQYLAELTAGSGTVTNRFGYYVTNFTGLGTVVNQYGLYIEALSGASTINRLIHADGALHLDAGGQARVAGYARIGALTVPANTAAGDLTAGRGIFGADAAIGVGLILDVHGATGTDNAVAYQIRDSAGTLRTFFNMGADNHVNMLVAGAASAPAGVLRILNQAGAAVLALWDNTGNHQLLGYLNVGAIAAPTNTTAGDLTAKRLTVGNDTAFTGGARFNLNVASLVPAALHTSSLITTVYAPAGLGSTAAALEVDAHVQNTLADAGEYWGGVFTAYHDGNSTFALTGSPGLVGLEGTVVTVAGATGTITEADGVRASIRPRAAATITWANAFRAIPGGSGADANAGSITNSAGLYIQNRVAGVPIATQHGVYIEALTGGSTDNIAIRTLGGTHRFVGGLIIGADAAPTAGYSLDVRAGNARFEIGGISRFDIQTASVTVGVDGSAPQLVLSAMDGVNEGGQAVFNGAAANATWTLDNSGGNIRWFTGGTVHRLMGANAHQLRGYLNVAAAVAAPTNTTAGDLSIGRLALSTTTALGITTGQILFTDANFTDTTATTKVLMGITPSISVGVNNVTAEYRTLNFLMTTIGTDSGNLSNATGLQIFRADFRHRSSGVVTRFAGIEVFAGPDGLTAPANGTITTIDSIELGYIARNATTSITTTWRGLLIDNAVLGTGPAGLTNQIGIDIAALSGASVLNIGLRNAATTVFTPSASQAITAAGNAILANATVVIVSNTTAGPITLTSAPTIADGADGQILVILGATGSTQNIVVQDQGTLAGSNLRLGAATRTITARDVLVLMYSANVGDWVEVSFNAVL